MTNQCFMRPARSGKRKKGFTLTEIAIVLGIIGLILGAIWVAAASVYQNQRTAHANTAILQIAQGIRTLYATTAQFTAASTDITSDLALAKVIPSDMIQGTAAPFTAIDPWAGGVTQVYTNATSDGFSILMSNVPQSACIALLLAVGGSARDQSLYAAGATTASGVVVTAALGAPVGGAPSAGQMAQITPTDATAACSAVGSNVVGFSFGLK